MGVRGDKNLNRLSERRVHCRDVCNETGSSKPVPNTKSVGPHDIAWTRWSLSLCRCMSWTSFFFLPIENWASELCIWKLRSTGRASSTVARECWSTSPKSQCSFHFVQVRQNLPNIVTTRPPRDSNQRDLVYKKCHEEVCRGKRFSLFLLWRYCIRKRSGCDSVCTVPGR